MRTIPPLFKASASLRGKTVASEPTENLAIAIADAWTFKRGQWKAVTVLRDSRGADHPDNAGKYFLYQIVK